MYLNAVDSQIESAQMTAMLAGEPAKKSEGYVVHGISDISPKKRNRMLNTIKKGIDTEENAKASQASGADNVVQTPKPVPKPASKP